jgi:glutaredoxin
MKLQTLLAVALFALVCQGIVSAAVSPTLTPTAASEEGAAAGKAETAVPQVELYVTSWCPYCKKAENFFRSQGIPFTVYDVEKDSSAARRKEQLDSRNGVPFAIINGQKIHGYSEGAYREALQKKP